MKNKRYLIYTLEGEYESFNEKYYNIVYNELDGVYIFNKNNEAISSGILIRIIY